VNLSGADLSGADFSDTDLKGANLDGANLSGASLRNAVLNGARLRDTDMTRAGFMWTLLANVDLSAVVGLDTVFHGGPSTLGLDTFYRSQGRIPEPFLRGAGVPENFIAIMKSLTPSAFDFYSCFISYSSKDQDFADHLHADLQVNGVRCWFASHDIQGGRKIHEQIDEAIRTHDRLLLIVSDASMSSNWVKTEIADARAREVKEKRQMLFPIGLSPFERIESWKQFDAGTGIDSASEIRQYFIPDFSNWRDHDSYARAFGRLLRDLSISA
jgi:uncharacterized protein YjbI with pentapeptide repeats